MPRLDHVAVESQDPARIAAFYERFLGARIGCAAARPRSGPVEGDLLRGLTRDMSSYRGEA
jgi:catechol 2,3-dioxygenase-like lactoylglutathione lyase family enzyme